MTLELELLEVAGFVPAVLSVRAAMKSYDKMEFVDRGLGESDKRLLTSLVKAGPEHRKGIRQIMAWFSIKAPRYWWQEFDTYRIGIDKGSESTMHTLLSRPLTLEDLEEGTFSHEDLDKLNELVAECKQNNSIENLVALKGKLPEGFLQKRYICASYEALRTIYQQRKSHRLPHWSKFCKWLEDEFPESWIFSITANS
jgi:hypothetical protein